jgi:LPS O-antigen subunit length determinant protein (WzzB/FepE family)
MKNSNLINENPEDEMDLRELLRIIINSKKIIFIVTVAFSLLAFIYTTQKEQSYQSTVVLEVGSYDLINGENKLVLPVSTLIKQLKINQISQQLNQLNFNSIEDRFLEINYTSLSPEFNENLINEAIKFAQEINMKTLENVENSLSEKIIAIENKIVFLKNSLNEKIVATGNKINFLKSSLDAQQKSRKFIAINSIKTIDTEIPALEAKIKFLLELIREEENNLLLLQSNPKALLLRTSSPPSLQQTIYSYNAEVISLKIQIQNLMQKKENFEMQVKSIEEGEFASAELFRLQHEKDAFEMQVKSIEEGEFVSLDLIELKHEKDALEFQIKLSNDQKNQTYPIRELVTSEIKPKQLLTILLGTICGFIFSLFIVFIRETLLPLPKKQN